VKPAVQLRPAALALLLALAACSTPGPQPPPPAAPTEAAPLPQAAADDPGLAEFRRTQQARALRAQAQGAWAEAALALEALLIVWPDDASLQAQLAEVRRRIDSGVSEHLQKAESLYRKGDLDQAAQIYLEVLALDPSRTLAAESLRAIERERNRRSFVGKFSRLTLTKRAASNAEMRSDEESERGRSANSLLEHASMLLRQGDADSAIQLLRDSPQSREDGPLKSLLVDLYVQRAEGLKTRNPGAARTAVDAALALDKQNKPALALARQLPRSRPAASRAASVPASGAKP